MITTVHLTILEVLLEVIVQQLLLHMLMLVDLLVIQFQEHYITTRII